MHLAVEAAGSAEADLVGAGIQFPHHECNRRVGHGTIPIRPRQRPNAFPALRPCAATGQIVDWRMDPAPDAGNAGLVGGVVISGPL